MASVDGALGMVSFYHRGVLPDDGPGASGDGLLLSVRGDATESVDPDFGELHVSLTVSADNKADASIEAGRLLDNLLTGLRVLGGVLRTGESAQERLTWVTTSVRTHQELGIDPATGEKGYTGRWFSGAQLVLRVRDFDLLEPLQAILDGHDTVTVQFVTWHIDRTNPIWPRVRESAIRDAIRRGHDYAVALGGRLLHIEHVADLGLLGGNDQPALAVAAGTRRAMSGGGGPGPARLDPVPQDITAVIEARFTATAAPLDAI